MENRLNKAAINEQIGQLVNATMTDRLNTAAQSERYEVVDTAVPLGKIEAIGESKIRMRHASASNPTPEDAHVDTFLSRIFLDSLPGQFQADVALGSTRVAKPNGKYTYLDSSGIRQSAMEAARTSPGAVAAEVDIAFGEDTYSTDMWALRAVIPNDTLAAQDRPINLIRQYTAALQHMILSARDEIVGKVLSTVTHYGRDVTTAGVLTGSNVDIPKVMQDYTDEIRRKSGQRNINLVMNEKTANKLAYSDSVLRNKDIRGSRAERLRQLAGLCGINRIVAWTSTRINDLPNLNPSSIKPTETDDSKYINNFNSTSSDVVALIATSPGLMNTTSFGTIFNVGGMSVRRYRLVERLCEVVEIRYRYGVKILDQACGIIFTNA